MSMRRNLLSSAGRGVALAVVAALIATVVEAPPVQARAAAPRQAKAVSMELTSSAVTDFSAARRRARRHYGNNNAAAIAAFGAVAGIIGGVISTLR